MRQIQKFVKGCVFHICNKSIANFGIFKDPINAERFVATLDHYNTSHKKVSLSQRLRRKKGKVKQINLLEPEEDGLIKFITFTIMPDHYHLVIKILVDHCLSKYINDVENSFTRYFNVKFERKGPLWQSRFRSILIKTDEQLLHVTRYIHLNPVTDYLVDKPEDWEFSSYRHYINEEKFLKNIFTEISIKAPKTYKKFVEDRIDYQRKLKKIKTFLLE
ncbi:transposase [Candidatus Roizmanbacteria bacterium]|nr:transposase [Candidatus Roizmanbacteria bacterium]